MSADALVVLEYDNCDVCVCVGGGEGEGEEASLIYISDEALRSLADHDAT